MTPWAESLLAWICAALLLFWFVGAHNRLVRLRSAAVQAYGALDALIVRQIDYVQTHAAPPPQPGEAPAAAETGASALRAAASQLLAVLGATRARPLEPDSMGTLSAALHVLLGAWARQHPDRVVVFEADGTLSRPAALEAPADEGAPPAAGPAPLAWPEPMALIEITRAQFNAAVAQYNEAIGAFPAFLVAWIFRWRPGAPLL